MLRAFPNAPLWLSSLSSLSLHRRYGEITGQTINECSFKVLKDDEVHSWLGASPDGLVQPLGMLAPLICHLHCCSGSSTVRHTLKTDALWWCESLMTNGLQAVMGDYQAASGFG